MTFVLRLWDFDMDSSVLGPIRCSRVKVEKKFAEFEETIRAGTVDSIELARNVFRAVARRRTGDSAIDARCGGTAFTEEEVSTVPLGELDLFCDNLLKGCLLRVATPTSAERSPAAPPFPPGRDGLAPALLYAVERDRATSASAVEAAKRSAGSLSLEFAHNKFGLFDAVGGDPTLRAMQEMRRNEDLIKSALGLTSVSSVAQAMAEVNRSKDLLRAAAGTDDFIKSVLGHTPKSAALEALTGFRRVEEASRAATINSTLSDLVGIGGSKSTLDAIANIRAIEDATRTSVLGPDNRHFVGMSGRNGAEVVQADHVPHLEFTLPHVPVLPPNPIHETNAKLRELLAHQKKEAEKIEADRVQAKASSGDNEKIAKSGLLYTKASFWVSVIASFVIPAAAFIWTYISKEVSEKKSAIQIEQLRAEVRALKGRGTAPELPKQTLATPKPVDQTNAQPKHHVVKPPAS